MHSSGSGHALQRSPHIDVWDKFRLALFLFTTCNSLSQLHTPNTIFPYILVFERCIASHLPWPMHYITLPSPESCLETNIPFLVAWFHPYPLFLSGETSIPLCLSASASLVANAYIASVEPCTKENTLSWTERLWW